MKKIAFAVATIMVALNLSAAENQSNWTLESSTLTYQISFPMHHPRGVSTAATGSGVTSADGCEFRVTAPVASFDSRNKKRDAEMRRVMRADSSPDVVVTATFAQLPTEGEFKADLKIDMSGETAVYKEVPFKVISQTAETFEVQGEIPMLLEDFKVERPAMMGVKIKNLCPVAVKASWKLQPVTAPPADAE